LLISLEYTFSGGYAKIPIKAHLAGRSTQALWSAFLDIRQHIVAVGRRVNTLGKGEDGLCQQLALYHTYDDFCLPHGSLLRALPEPVSTKGAGSAKKWRPQTPAMAAGLIDHVWTRCEVLMFRVPPWPEPQGL
jgi:hypothetical protein